MTQTGVERWGAELIGKSNEKFLVRTYRNSRAVLLLALTP